MIDGCQEKIHNYRTELELMQHVIEEQTRVRNAYLECRYGRERTSTYDERTAESKRLGWLALLAN